MAKAFYKTDLPAGAKWRGQVVSSNGTVELAVLSVNEDGSMNLGAEKELIVGKVKKGDRPGTCVVAEEAAPKKVEKNEKDK